MYYDVLCNVLMPHTQTRENKAKTIEDANNNKTKSEHKIIVYRFIARVYTYSRD